MLLRYVGIYKMSIEQVETGKLNEFVVNELHHCYQVFSIVHSLPVCHVPCC